MGIRPPFGGTWENFRDGTGKWLAWLLLMGGAIVGFWKWASPFLGWTAPYVFGTLPLGLGAFAVYWAIRCHRSLDLEVDLPLALFLLALPELPGLVIASLVLHDGRSTLLNVHLWTFVASASVSVFVIAICGLWWLSYFYEDVWRRLLFLEAFISELKRHEPNVDPMLDAAEKQGDNRWLHDPTTFKTPLIPRKIVTIGLAGINFGSVEVRIKSKTEPPPSS
jgi:hypothetical protein